MKRVILFLFLCNTLLQAQAQFFKPYLQIATGVAVNQKNGGLFCAEFGTRYKWFELGLAVDYESNSFFKEYIGELNIFKIEGYDPSRNHNDEFSYFANTSFQLIAKVDLIRLFTDKSRHSIKIGGGYGLIRYHEIWSTGSFNESSEVEYNLTAKSDFGLLGSLKTTYEYKINPKISVGAYFGGTYYPSIGLLLRSNI